LRTGIDAEHEHDCARRFHEEREREHQCQGLRPAEPGQNSESRTDENAENNERDVQRIEDKSESWNDLLKHPITTSDSAAGRSAASTPKAPARRENRRRERSRRR